MSSPVGFLEQHYFSKLDEKILLCRHLPKNAIDKLDNSIILLMSDHRGKNC